MFLLRSLGLFLVDPSVLQTGDGEADDSGPRPLEVDPLSDRSRSEDVARDSDVAHGQLEVVSCHPVQDEDQTSLRGC